MFILVASRPSVSSCVSWRRLVLRASRLCRVVRRSVSSARLSSRFACRLVWAPFRSAVRSSSVSFVVAVLSCVPVPPRLFACRPACPCVPSARLVSVVSFPLVISFGLARGRLVSVLMPGSRLPRRSVLLVARSSLIPFVFVRPPPGSSCSRPRSWGVAGRHGHDGGGGACSRPVSSVSSLLILARSFARCGMALWGGMGMGRRSMLLAARSFPTHAPSFLPISSVPRSLVCVLIQSSTKQENERDGDGAETKGGLERDAPNETRRREARRRR